MSRLFHLCTANWYKGYHNMLRDYDWLINLIQLHILYYSETFMVHGKFAITHIYFVACFLLHTNLLTWSLQAERVQTSLYGSLFLIKVIKSIMCLHWRLLFPFLEHLNYFKYFKRYLKSLFYETIILLDIMMTNLLVQYWLCGRFVSWQLENRTNCSMQCFGYWLNRI